MQEGKYVADEYTIVFNGKSAHGRFDEMNKDPDIAKLDPESRSAMEVCSEMVYDFKNGEWHKSTNGGRRFAGAPGKNYKVEGEKIILFTISGTPNGKTLLLRDDRIEEPLGSVLSVFYRRE
jgi:hypothetical protein